MTDSPVFDALVLELGLPSLYAAYVPRQRRRLLPLLELVDELTPERLS